MSATAGKASFNIFYDLNSLSGKRMTTASSVQVLFDPRKKEKIIITGAWLEKIAKVEGRIPDRLADHRRVDDGVGLFDKRGG